jgi:RNA polymerase sigma-70 factor (ECF subfamily)
MSTSPIASDGRATASAARGAATLARAGDEPLADDCTFPSFDQNLVAVLPSLRGYARFLTGNRQDADDLVQDAVVRMLRAADSFKEGTNLRAWAFTVMRNRFLNDIAAKHRRLVCLNDIDMAFASVSPTQTHGLECQDLARQFMRLPAESRSVLALAAGENLPYEEIAQISGCAVGTVKSRVHRARAALQRLLYTAYGRAANTA